jgi:hypothetical protein
MRQWMKTLHTSLKPKGRFVMIHRPDMLPVLLEAMQGRFGAIHIRPVHGKAGRPATRILVSGVKGSRAPLTLLEPLVLHDAQGKRTPEEEAIARCREFWKIHAGVKAEPPLLWINCSDGDRAFAIETEHIEEWKTEYPGVDTLAICQRMGVEVRGLRKKPAENETWAMLFDLFEKRLRRITRKPAGVCEDVSHANEQELLAA